jgi:Tfp pilus assembly protein PilZ
VSHQEREHPRYAHDAAVELHMPDRAIMGRMANLSSGGLCATLAEPIPIGTDLEIDIQLVFDDDRRSEPLRLPGRIVWCTAVGKRHQIGVRFLSIDSEKAEDLTMFLRYLDDHERAEASKHASSIDERFG